MPRPPTPGPRAREHHPLSQRTSRAWRRRGGRSRCRARLSQLPSCTAEAVPARGTPARPRRLTRPASEGSAQGRKASILACFYTPVYKGGGHDVCPALLELVQMLTSPPVLADTGRPRSSGVRGARAASRSARRSSALHGYAAFLLARARNRPTAHSFAPRARPFAPAQNTP